MQALIIDGTSDATFSVRTQLRRSGYMVMEAQTGRDALAYLRHLATETPRVAFVHWHLSDMSAVEFVRAVRMNPVLDGMTVVLVIAEDVVLGRDVAAAFNAGVAAYLVVPCSDARFARTLQQLGIADHSDDADSDDDRALPVQAGGSGASVKAGAF